MTVMAYFDVPNIHTPNHNFLLGKPVPNSPYGLCQRKATLKRERERDVKVEVAVLIVLTVSVSVKQH